MTVPETSNKKVGNRAPCPLGGDNKAMSVPYLQSQPSRRKAHYPEILSVTISLSLPAGISLLSVYFPFNKPCAFLLDIHLTHEFFLVT